MTSHGSSAAGDRPGSPRRRPRDAQRSRVYLAETPLPSSPLPGLDACARFVDRVVGTLWWHERFPDRDLGIVPRCARATARARRSSARRTTGPTITLPRRYRTKGVVLHELTHWALGIDSGLPHHGRTFARVLLDATDEFCGADRAAVLASSYREHGVHVGTPPRRRARRSPALRMGRAPPAREGPTCSRWRSRPPTASRRRVTGTFVGYERGSSVVRLRTSAATRSRASRRASVWDVARC